MQLHLKMEKKGPKQTNLCPCLGEAWRMLMGFLESAVHAKHSRLKRESPALGIKHEQRDKPWGLGFTLQKAKAGKPTRTGGRKLPGFPPSSLLIFPTPFLAKLLNAEDCKKSVCTTRCNENNFELHWQCQNINFPRHE